MNLLKPTQVKCLLIVILFAALFSCTYTKSFPPKLNSKGDTVLSHIKSTYHFDDIDLVEKTTSGSQVDETVLTLKLFNGKTLPAEADTAALKKLGKVVASEIKTAVVDAAKINTYTILFCTRVIDGNSTNTNYIGYEYKSSDL